MTTFASGGPRALLARSERGGSSSMVNTTSVDLADDAAVPSTENIRIESLLRLFTLLAHGFRGSSAAIPCPCSQNASWPALPWPSRRAIRQPPGLGRRGGLRGSGTGRRSAVLRGQSFRSLLRRSLRPFFGLGRSRADRDGCAGCRGDNHLITLRTGCHRRDRSRFVGGDTVNRIRN